MLKTEVGRDYQEDILAKELKRLRKKLGGHLNALNNLTGTREIWNVKEERNELNKCFSELCNVVERLKPLVEVERSQELETIIQMESESVANVDIAVDEWVKAMEGVEKESIVSMESRTSSQKDKLEHNPNSSPTKASGHGSTSLPGGSLFEVMSKHSKLEKQISLMNDVLSLDDEGLLKAEMKNLRTVYEDLLQSSVEMNSESLCEENEKIQEIIKLAMARVEEIKFRTKEKLNERRETEEMDLGIKSSDLKHNSETRSQQDNDESMKTHRKGGDDRIEAGGSVSSNTENFRFKDAGSDHHHYNPMERMQLNFQRLQRKVANEISLAEGMMEVGGRKVLQERLKRLEKLEEEVGIAYFQSSQFFSGGGVNKEIENSIEEEENKIQKMKQKIVMMMREEGKDDDERSRVSSISRSSRASKGSSVDKSRRASQVLTLEISDLFDQDMIRCENQLGYLRDLCQAKNDEALRQEIGKAESILESMHATAKKISGMVPAAKVKSMFEFITEKEEEVIKYKRKLMKHRARETDDNVSAVSASTTRSGWTEVSSKSVVRRKKERKRICVDSRSGISFASRSSRASKVSSVELGEKLAENSNGLSHEISELFEQDMKRVESQLTLLKSLNQAGDIKSLRREIGTAEIMLKSMRGTTNETSDLVPPKKVKNMLKLMAEKEEEVIEYKRRMIMQSVRREKEDSKSAISGSTRKTHFTEVVPKRSPKGKNESQSEEKTQQIEKLREDLGACKTKLIEEKAICREMLGANNCLSEGGIKNLERVFNEMEGVVFRLREQVTSIEIDEMTKMLEVEDNEVFELKREAIKQIVTDKETEGGTAEKEAKQSCSLGNTVPTRVREGEAARAKNRLDNQMSIIDDLLKSENEELLDQELQVLDKVYDDYVAIITQLRGMASGKEAERLSVKIDEEDNKVFRKKELVSKLKSLMKKKEIQKDSGNCHKERVASNPSGAENLGDAEPSNGQSQNDHGNASSMLRLNELMMQTMKLQAAPKVEIDIFYGDPLEYSYFLENFKDVVENLIDDPKQRLLRLLKYTDGDAKQLIKHCVHEQRETCYETALSLLQKEYGSPQRIACAYHERLKNWPQIRANDAVGMKSLYRFLLRCLSYQKSGKIDLNSPLTIRSIQLSLPNNLQDKWVSRVGRIRKKDSREAEFADFVEFVEDESHCLNDPVYARGAAPRADKKEERKQCAAIEMEVKGEEDKKTDKGAVEVKCQLCAAQHDLDDCPTFKEKTAREKKDFLFKTKMCFACYGSNHRADKCKERRICGICELHHPTGLHDVTFKVSAVKQGGSGMCIVPIKMKHESWQTKELEVYAMLDECSDGTFIDEKLLHHFKEDIQRRTEISVQTVNGDRNTTAMAIEGIIVRGAAELGEDARYHLKLPETFSQTKLPMSREDITSGEDLAKWHYLEKVARTLPGVRDIPLGLIIGNNCPKALEPLEVVASKDGGPYAKRTRLGWCVSAPSSEGDPRGLTCNRIRVVETRMKDNSIGNALQKMWEEDFVEKESEKKALSREDRWFVEKMKESIQFCQGHYVLPLPLRTNNMKVHKEELKCNESSLEFEDLNTRTSLETQENQMKACGKISLMSAEEWDAMTKGPMDVKEMGNEVVQMPKNRNQALHRLKGTRRRMARDESFRKEYSAFIDKLLNSGYAAKVPKHRLGERAWYLNHHGVRHPVKKKLRVVYDCSAVMDEVSLNSVLVQGPDISNSLLGILLRFRKGRIPIMADIESMYYQVKIPVEHRKFVRFLWWEDGNIDTHPIELEMCVHVFGATSSKNCVTFALHQTARDNMAVFGKEAMKCLLEEFYVDDFLKSLDEEEEAISLIKNVTGMCAAGGFNLTKFLSTNEKVIASIPKEKRAEGLKTYEIGNTLPDESALGVLWNMQGDAFGFCASFKADNGTMRGCLSTISRFKDPLGLAAPFLLKGRKILQKLTKSSVSWDDQLPYEEAKLWSDWRKEVELLETLNIGRCYRSKEFGKVVETSLHCFSDASFVGYGVAAYLRMVDESGKVDVALVMGKSRVCPLKPTTVPRLELTAATVSAKIAALLVEELKIPGMEVYFWVDNKIVLGYILNDQRRFRIYVANRIRLIDEYSEKRQWHYIDTKENPSDFASRGISPNEKDKVEMWLNGPHFLRSPDVSWKYKRPEVVVIADDKEVKQENVVHAIRRTEFSVLNVLETRVSSWNRMIRILVWMMRFVSKEWKKTKEETISVAEIESAKIKLIKLIQVRAYGDEIERLKSEGGPKTVKGLEKLDPMIDDRGVLRVGGRLARAEASDLFRFPIIIPKKAVATRRLIEWHHRRIEHRGKHSTVGRLRDQGYWIVGASKEVGSVVHRCVRCRWLRGKALGQKMADLPWNRTTTEPPFTYCGADVFGPMYVKEGRKEVKRYGVVFTCFSLRAVHIELLATMETDSFIQSLRRLIGRRGAVREIRSDNGSNFVGADNELKKAMEEINHKKVGEFLTSHGCDYVVWERNTPLASHMGGVWERQIRTIKSVLCSLLKTNPKKLDEESLRTFLTEAECIVNSRPLSLENLHNPDTTPLTPNQLLTMKTFVASPPPGEFQQEGAYARKRWRVVQHLANSFWSRWKREYLQLLQTRQKWTGERRNLRVNDVVMMKEEGTGRGQWPLGRVTEVHPSKDGLVRSVTLQVRGTTLKRPVHKTVLLLEADELQK